MTTDPGGLENFGGVVRLFPLPNVVLFPHVIQPLHIFEPRYRQMTADALVDDRLIAPALLSPGWEGDYEGRPAIHSVVCIGRIVGDQKLEDGRYNLLLRGLHRARVQREVQTGKLYRSAEVEVLNECGDAGDQEQELGRRLKQCVQPWLPQAGPGLGQLQKLFQQDLPLGVLCDLLAFLVSLPVQIKQELLQELNVVRRAESLVRHLQKGEPPAPPEASKFPPAFSPN